MTGSLPSGADEDPEVCTPQLHPSLCPSGCRNFRGLQARGHDLCQVTRPLCQNRDWGTTLGMAVAIQRGNAAAFLGTSSPMDNVLLYI